MLVNLLQIEFKIHSSPSFPALPILHLKRLLKKDLKRSRWRSLLQPLVSHFSQSMAEGENKHNEEDEKCEISENRTKKQDIIDEYIRLGLSDLLIIN